MILPLVNVDGGELKNWGHFSCQHKKIFFHQKRAVTEEKSLMVMRAI